jgi:hypothetical protein
LPSTFFRGSVVLRVFVEPKKFLNPLEQGEGFRFGRTAARPRSTIPTIVSATLIITTSFTISTALTLLIAVSVSVSVSVAVSVAVAIT